METLPTRLLINFKILCFYVAHTSFLYVMNRDEVPLLNKHELNLLFAIAIALSLGGFDFPRA